MKSLLMLVALSVVSLNGVAASHRLATFNVRYCATADKGGKEWCNRAPFAMGIVTKYDFDVVGLQELSGDGRKNNNSLTGKSQLEEFRECLEGAGYTFLAWDRDGTADREYVGLAFKSGRYDLMDSGSFFISPTPDTFSYGWDKKIATHPRVLGWVKLKEKDTGEIFFYAATHTNNGWTLDGVYGSQLVAERMREIAGDYPVMVVADYNMQRIPRDEKAYKAYRASFKDARFEVPEDKNYCLPTTLPATEGTYGAFNTTASGHEFKEIDYQFFRRMKIMERHIVVDTYDYKGTEYPVSDHCPLFVVAELEAPAAPRMVYVDAEASAGGDGTKDAPYNSVAVAAANADVDDILMVTEGVYNESVIPGNTLTILGGYDKGFGEVTGKTILDGEGLDYPLVYIPKDFSLTMKNCELRNYRSKDAARDGALLFRGCTLTLENVDFTGNEAVGYGGAISAMANPGVKPYYADCNSIIATRCTFRENKAANGGAVGAGFYDTFRLDGCTFDGNEATSSGGALYLGCGTPVAEEIWFTNAEAIIVNSSFVDNKSGQSGALHVNDEMPAVKFTVANSTFANNSIDSQEMTGGEMAPCGGTAIHARLADVAANGDAKADLSVLNLGHVTVTGNRAVSSAASAVDVTGGEVRLVNNIIAGNSSIGTEAPADIAVANRFRVARDTRNLYSSPVSVSFTPGSTAFIVSDAEAYAKAFPALMDGKMEDGVFHANVTREEGKTPYVKPVSTTYGGREVNMLEESMRNVERIFSIDIDGDGKVGNPLNFDQNGTERASKSIPGAIEYVAPSSIDNVSADADDTITLVCITADSYLLTSSVAIDVVHIADLAGRLLQTIPGNGATSLRIDLSSLPASICLVTCGSRTFKVVR